jgi:hypothetical protein
MSNQTHYGSNQKILEIFEEGKEPYVSGKPFELGSVFVSGRRARMGPPYHVALHGMAGPHRGYRSIHYVGMVDRRHD